MLAWHGGRPRHGHQGAVRMVLQTARTTFVVRGVTREGNTTMNYKRVAGVVGGAAAGAAIVGSEIAMAQDDLGASIAGSVGSSVSGIATSSGGDVSGGAQVEHNEIHLGESEGLAISDASGGNHNVSFVS